MSKLSWRSFISKVNEIKNDTRWFARIIYLQSLPPSFLISLFFPPCLSIPFFSTRNDVRLERCLSFLVSSSFLDGDTSDQRLGMWFGLVNAMVLKISRRDDQKEQIVWMHQQNEGEWRLFHWFCYAPFLACCTHHQFHSESPWFVFKSLFSLFPRFFLTYQTRRYFLYRTCWV